MSREKNQKWIDFHQEQMKKKISEDIEKLKYTAQEGSTLDKIWKGEYKVK